MKLVGWFVIQPVGGTNSALVEVFRGNLGQWWRFAGESKVNHMDRNLRTYLEYFNSIANWRVADYQLFD